MFEPEMKDEDAIDITTITYQITEDTTHSRNDLYIWRFFPTVQLCRVASKTHVVQIFLLANLNNIMLNALLLVTAL